MPTPVGYAHFLIEIDLDNDEDAFAVTHGLQTDLASASAVEHCNKVMSAFGGAWDQVLSNNAQVSRAIGYFGQDGTDDLIVESDLVAIPGTSAGAKLPQNCAALVKKRTGLGGRKNRGRVYIPNVLNEAEVSDTGVITGSTVVNFQTYADQWFVNVTGTVGGLYPATPMVILHRDGSAPTAVTQLVMDPVLATQRRRLRR